MKKLTAIVVDDNIDAANVFTEYLEIKKIKVIGIGYNGKDAVDLYEKLRPGVIFLDVMMPTYDGFYALERIRTIDKNVIVIMVTGDLRPNTEKKLEDLLASAIVYKPYDMNKIVETVHQLSQNI